MRIARIGLHGKNSMDAARKSFSHAGQISRKSGKTKILVLSPHSYQLMLGMWHSFHDICQY